MRMSLIRAAIVGAAAIGALAATSGVASAASFNHNGAGVPGAANCSGQTAAFVSQGNFNNPPGRPFGLGNSSAAGGISVKQAQSEIQFYCATGIVP